MPWFKVDDHFWSHPKTAALSDAATALWLRAGSWSAGHLTDGRVPVSMLRFFRARRRSADELITAGLWSLDGETFVFHAWAEYQPSKEQVEAKREATRNRVNAWRERVGNGVTNTSQGKDGNAAPVPSRPVPTRPDPIETDSESPSSSVTRDTDETNDTAAISVLTGLRINPARLVKHINQHTGRNVTVTGAMQVALDRIDRGTNVENPQAYVLGSVKRSWNEVQQFIDEKGLSA